MRRMRGAADPIESQIPDTTIVVVVVPEMGRRVRGRYVCANSGRDQRVVHDRGCAPFLIEQEALTCQRRDGLRTAQ